MWPYAQKIFTNLIKNNVEGKSLNMNKSLNEQLLEKKHREKSSSIVQKTVRGNFADLSFNRQLKAPATLRTP
jgi:hypothetical protein